jgi:hypothetical protein
MIGFVGPPPERIEALVVSLLHVRNLLVRHGEERVSERLSAIESRLVSHDLSEIQSIISETSGGMGSLNDLILSASNGHDMDGLPEKVINDRLRRSVDGLRTQAVATRDSLRQLYPS